MNSPLKSPITNGNFTNATTSTTIFWIWYTPQTLSTVPTIIITQPSYYYTYSLYGYLIFLLLVCLFLIAIKLAYRRKQETARQAALARRARQRNDPAVTTSDNRTSEPPKDDLPPAYDEIVRTKLALQAAAEEGRMPTSQSNGQSTVTLATFVDASGSNTNLDIATTISTAESYETLPPAYENAVFEHENTVNGERNEEKNSTL